jgi:UDP-glucose 4-epimerase
VQDAILAILTLATTDSTIGDVFNVGGVGEITIKELAEQIIKQTNSSSSITYTPYSDAYPPGFEDMQRRVPDITKIKKTINWAPANTLTSIIDDVAQSMRG